MQKKHKKAPGARRVSWAAVALCTALAVVVLVLLYMMEYNWDLGQLPKAASTDAVSDVAPVGSVRVTEVMTSNKTAVADENGLYPDWVEVHNAGSEPVDVTAGR